MILTISQLFAFCIHFLYSVRVQRLFLILLALVLFPLWGQAAGDIGPIPEKWQTSLRLHYQIITHDLNLARHPELFTQHTEYFLDGQAVLPPAEKEVCVWKSDEPWWWHCPWNRWKMTSWHQPTFEIDDWWVA